jgi:hypothetical protein
MHFHQSGPFGKCRQQIRTLRSSDQRNQRENLHLSLVLVIFLHILLNTTSPVFAFFNYILNLMAFFH